MVEDSAFASLQKLLEKPLPLGRVLLLVLLTVLLVYWSQRHALDRPLVGPGQSLEIKNLIRKVKQELGEAEAEAIRNNELPLFKLEEFEMEINYVIRASGGLKAEVVSVGGSSEVGTEKVQKLRLRWSAVAPEQRIIKPGAVTGTADVDDSTPVETAKGRQQ